MQHNTTNSKSANSATVTMMQSVVRALTPTPETITALQSQFTFLANQVEVVSNGYEAIKSQGYETIKGEARHVRNKLRSQQIPLIDNVMLGCRLIANMPNIQPLPLEWQYNLQAFEAQLLELREKVPGYVSIKQLTAPMPKAEALIQKGKALHLQQANYEENERLISRVVVDSTAAVAGAAIGQTLLPIPGLGAGIGATIGYLIAQAANLAVWSYTAHYNKVEGFFDQIRYGKPEYQVLADEMSTMLTSIDNLSLAAPRGQEPQTTQQQGVARLQKMTKGSQQEAPWLEWSAYYMLFDIVGNAANLLRRAYQNDNLDDFRTRCLQHILSNNPTLDELRREATNARDYRVTLLSITEVLYSHTSFIMKNGKLPIQDQANACRTPVHFVAWTNQWLISAASGYQDPQENGEVLCLLTRTAIYSALATLQVAKDKENDHIDVSEMILKVCEISNGYAAIYETRTCENQRQ